MKIRNYYRDLGKSTAILSVKQGLTLVIPFLILGSFALLFKSFPYPLYQEFITAFLGGRILNILDAVYTITLGSFALLLTVIYSKSFMDIFVFIGGCGAALCLILALLIAAKKSHNRKLGKVAGVSVLFNISEIAIFGFPVIFNPVMFVPFILTPLVFVLTGTFAMTMGLVPYVTRSLEWTVPVIFSGYEATGSVAGSVLQIVNLVIGTLIYIPFIRYSEEKQTRNFF